MSVSKEDVLKVAHLARIKIDPNQISSIQENLNNILNFVEQLNEVDCSKVDKTIQYNSKLHERADEAKKCDPQVMANAPSKEYNMFVVPKVVE